MRYRIRAGEIGVTLLVILGNTAITRSSPVKWQEQWSRLEAPSVTRTTPSTTSLFGYFLKSPIGIAACPLTSSSHLIAQAAKHGYDIITGKTMHSHSHPGNMNNICHVQRCLKNKQHVIYHSHNTPSSNNEISLANWIGMPSPTPEIAQQEIAAARAALSEGQLLIVSVHGVGTTFEEQTNDFIQAAHLAYQAGAHAIEVNISCPNTKEGTLPYKNPQWVYSLCKAIHTALPEVPLIIKVGIFDSYEQMKAVLIAAHQAGIQAICGINTIPIKVVDAKVEPTCEVQTGGLSGTPLYDYTLQFIKDARTIIEEEKLNMALLATGGVTRAEQFDEFLAAGADIALTATGAMAHPALAQEYHYLHTSSLNEKKKQLISDLYNIGAIKLENVHLKSGISSPIYFDMRVCMSHPRLFNRIAALIQKKIASSSFDHICAVPYAALPLAAAVAVKGEYSMLMLRKETKDHGTKKMIEGAFNSQDTCVVIEDVITSGGSILEAVAELEKSSLKVKDIFVIIDREQKGVHNVQAKGYPIHALFTVSEVLKVLLEKGIITHKQYVYIKHSL